MSIVQSQVISWCNATDCDIVRKVFISAELTAQILCLIIFGTSANVTELSKVNPLLTPLLRTSRNSLLVTLSNLNTTVKKTA